MNDLTAFADDRLLARGARADLLTAVKSALAGGARVLVFDDRTGEQVDLDLRGDSQPVAGPEAPPEPRRPGRPKLGVVPREVTLLPRHWDWLGAQPGGASVTLRKLVDAARASTERLQTKRVAQQAADRFMLAMLGNQPGYEEAARALYAGNGGRFATITERWPADLRDHARRLAAPAFA